MKPSTQWCKLYSIESKYNFTLQNSTLVKQVPYYLAGLMFFVCFIILAYFGLHLSHQTIFLCSAATAFFTLCLCWHIKFNTLSTRSFFISNDGILTLAANKKYLLTKGSLVFSFGCALKLTEIKSKTLKQHQENKPLNKFIFKDELTDENYRRLCRIILRYKNSSNNPTH